MSDYTITTNFGAKDSLPSTDAGKVIKGSEFTTEFTNIQTAVATKADTAGDTFTGAVTFDAAVTNNAAVTVNSTATITGDLTVDTNTLFVDVSEDKVGIGTTSPANTLTVGNLTASANDQDATVGIKCNANHRGIILQENSGAEQWEIGVGAAGALKFYDSGSATPAVTFADETGKVGIGTDSPSYTLDIESTSPIIKLEDTDTNTQMLLNANSGVGGFNFEFDSTSVASAPYAAFKMSGSEAMRIDSSGNLLVGTTAIPTDDNTTLGFGVTSSGEVRASVNNGNAAMFKRSSSDGDIIEFRKDSTTVGSISVTGSATSYNTSSDERLKENIADSADAGSKVDAIQIRQFDWKADGTHQDYGVIAQELVEVAPEAVHQPVDEEDMMGVDYSKLVPMLIKEVQALRSRVAELENA